MKKSAFADWKKTGFTLTDPHNIQIELVGVHQVVTVDGVKVMDFEDKAFTQGNVGLRTWGTPRWVFGKSRSPRGLTF